MSKSLFTYFKECLTVNFVNFEGRARRSEFWGFVLCNAIVTMLLSFGLVFISLALEMPALILLVYLWAFAVFVPGLAVSIRRLHDTGRSGWWYLISLTGIGSFVLIYWYCSDSQPGVNKWGPNPKEVEHPL